METPTNLVSQLKEDYLSYSMAVLIGRSIPDMYDGLKPAQRRILQTMLEEGLLPNKPYVKCARTTGLTSAYYHPHGSAYGALINMATPWTNNVTWVDCHGNIGSSVDNCAAERYVENRLRQTAIDILLQDRNVWETRPNYDGSRKEAVRFNSSLPTVLLNGDAGIAVGFATKLAPHSLSSVVEAVKILSKDYASEKSQADSVQKARQVLLPDFPTGTQIVNDESLQEYTRTGSGNIRCMAVSEQGIQERSGKAKNRPTLTFTCLPPGTNPEKIGEQIKNELDKGRILGVAEVNDLSDITGDRVQVVAKPGIDVETLKKQLYAYTDLELKFSAKTLVIDGTKPVEYSPAEIIQKWIPWRLTRLQVRFSQELLEKGKRLHILQGLIKAIDKMDLVIKKIRESANKAEAKEALMSGTLKFTDEQAEAILEMRLRQLTNLDQEDLTKEKETLEQRVEELNVLVSEKPEGIKARKAFMIKEVTEIGKRYGEPRRSPLVEAPAALPGPASGNRSKAPAAAPKPRFVKVDLKKGVVEQAKGPRGAMVVDAKEKVIFLTEDGVLKKLPANFKGTLTSSYCQVSLAKRESEVSNRKYLTVFQLGEEVRACVLSGEDLCRTTSKGKKWLPDGAKLLYFGEGKFTVNWTSKRKKPVELDLSVKQGKPGTRGSKVGNLREMVAPGKNT